MDLVSARNNKLYSDVFRRDSKIDREKNLKLESHFPIMGESVVLFTISCIKSTNGIATQQIQNNDDQNPFKITILLLFQQNLNPSYQSTPIDDPQ